jgi:hypothetical protein
VSAGAPPQAPRERNASGICYGEETMITALMDTALLIIVLGTALIPW